MKTDARIARLLGALLYEGYALYPYRASALKNARRWTIGALEPGQGLVTRFLVAGPPGASLDLSAVFLHPRGSSWQEADERTVEAGATTVGALAAAPLRLERSWGEDAAREQQGVRLGLEVSARPVTGSGEPGFEVTVRLANATEAAPCPRQGNALASAHVLARVESGAFVSLQDPPPSWEAVARTVRQEGAWPVLAGEPGDRSVVLASPIILADHPEVAPESPGDLFDATEIDEILSLRILTLTDEEKAEARARDPRVRALLERTEALGPAGLGALHGALRQPSGQTVPVHLGPRRGDRVRVRPRRRGPGDVWDLVLDGKRATVAAVERDPEGRVHVAVTVDDDPGRDLGEHAHRFFFAPDELEVLERAGREGDA